MRTRKKTVTIPRVRSAKHPPALAGVVGLVVAAISGCAGSSATVPDPTSPVRVLSPSTPVVAAVTEREERQLLLPSPTAYEHAAPFVEVSATEARCPSEMALVDDAVCVDKWEAHVVFLRDGREQKWSPYRSLDEVRIAYRAAAEPGVVPQGYISGEQAAYACEQSGKRLCAPGEWDLACRGVDGRKFPYGSEKNARACNDDGRAEHPAVEASRRVGISGEDVWTEGMNLPTINQLENALEPAGKNASCQTPEGVFDLVGNLHEWVDDASGTFRGGYYMDTEQNGSGCSYQTTAHGMGYHDYSTGFRCCVDPYDVE